jgi:hypothetical protein
MGKWVGRVRSGQGVMCCQVGESCKCGWLVSVRSEGFVVWMVCDMWWVGGWCPSGQSVCDMDVL